MNWEATDNGWRRSVDRPNTLVIVLHGHSRSGAIIKTNLGEPLSRGLPRAAFLAPDGFEAYDGGDYEGRQWFSRKDITPELRLERLRAAHPALQRLIEDELARVGLPPERLVLAGFSQGAIFALHHAATAPQRHALVLAYSGRLATPVTAGNGTSVAIVHGTADQGVDEVRSGAGQLREAGHAVDLHLLEGLGHAVSEEGVRLGIEAIRRASNTNTPL
jgi:phospholipase/carboxylesterase